jgi:predicted enzyme related to lactoylglutathione lyase
VQVEQVDFVTIPTHDTTRALSWYHEVLGLPLSPQSDGEVETPNLTLSFWEPERDGLEFKPTEAGIALRVADVKVACEELVASGGELIGFEDSGVCHMGFCKDPEGNVLILHRRYKPHAA